MHTSASPMQRGTSLGLLEVTDLTLSYGAVRAVRGVSLSVDEGQCLALLGANGAGKSSTLRAITRLQEADSGTVRLDGVDLSSLNPAQVVGLGIAMVPEGRRVFPGLSVYDNLMLGAFRIDEPEHISSTLSEVYELFPRLQERRQQQAGSLSGGEQQMLAIGRALMAQPRMLLLDEPSMGLAPVIVKQIFATLSALRQRGVTMLVVEQNANLALKLCERALVLRSGKVVLEGASGNLRSEALRDAYLG